MTVLRQHFADFTSRQKYDGVMSTLSDMDHCAGCGAPLSLRTRSDYCRACRNKVIKRKTRLKKLTPRCLGCKEKMTRMAPDGLCGACRSGYNEAAA